MVKRNVLTIYNSKSHERNSSQFVTLFGKLCENTVYLSRHFNVCSLKHMKENHHHQLKLIVFLFCFMHVLYLAPKLNIFFVLWRQFFIS